MKAKKFLITLTIYLLLFCGLDGQSTPENITINDSLYTDILINHLRNNFDDIHDVSMRFHHKDHSLNGLIVLGLLWKDGRLISHSIERNDTTDEEFATALISIIGKWYIKDLKDSFNFRLPLKIKIVGSDDSTFTEKGIFTGQIIDVYGNPLSGVKISFISTNNAEEILRSTYSNREGIFVKTLIPIGSWNIVIEADGFKSAVLENFNFQKGEHLRKKIMLSNLNDE